MSTIVEMIVSRKINAAIVFENDNVIAFLDHEPISKGHILICPKKPYESIIDVPLSILTEVMSVAQSLYAKFCDRYSPDGVTLMQNN